MRTLWRKLNRCVGWTRISDGSSFTTDYRLLHGELISWFAATERLWKFSDARARIRYDAHPPWLQSLVTRNLINKRNWISIRPSLPQNININLLLFLFVIFFQCDNDKINFPNSIGIWKLIQFAVVSHDYTSGDSAEYSKTFHFYDVSKLDSTST